MDVRRSEGSFGGEGIRLFRRSWVSGEPLRVVLLVHGFGEHSGRYEELGAWLSVRGCAVHAFDHRGHGRSKGPTNYVGAFDEYLDDLDCFLELVRGEHPNLPVTLVGHSMGGLVTVAYVRERRPEIASLVTSGAALELGPAMRGPKMVLARVLRFIAPRLLFDAGLPADGLSRDPEVVRRYLADPLVDTRTTAGLGVEMMRGIERTAAGGAEIEVPMLLLHGGDDALCSPQGSESFFASLRPGAAPPSRLVIYPGLRHEIFNEPEREQVFEELLGWLVAQESPQQPELPLEAADAAAGSR
jgi:alpha-beta hydrolase superfamily lysophospholipase